MGRTIKYGEIYDSDNFGQFIPIEYIGGPEDLVKIKFLNTGSERIVSSNALIHGKVKDLYMPIVAGVGYLGSFNGKVSDKDKIIFYKPWNDMLNRCYNIADKDYPAYGGSGVRVDQRWFDFGNFFEDAKLLYGYENKLKYPSIYCLDKDYKQMNIPKNQKIYSLNTCIWISKYDNIIIMTRENSKSKYFGVTKTQRGFLARYSRHIIGYFSNEIAAANAYNFYYMYNFKNDPFRSLFLLNDVPYMSPTEFIKYNLNAKEVIKVVK